MLVEKAGITDKIARECDRRNRIDYSLHVDLITGRQDRRDLFDEMGGGILSNENFIKRLVHRSNLKSIFRGVSNILTYR